MKKLLALLMIAAFVFSMLPLAAVAVTGGPEFAIKIDGKYTSAAKPAEYWGLHKCDTIEVEIIAWEVTDLYAYEFKVTWDQTYLTLTDHELKHIHTADYVLKEKAVNYPVSALPTLSYYQQAVTAVAPATGVTGTFTLANLFFHIEENPQWPVDIPVLIHFSVAKMSDSSTGDMNPSTEDGFILLVAIPPVLKMLPPVTTKSVLGETFEVQIEIQDVVKMKSFHFTITWDDHQMTTDSQNVWVKDFLHAPYETASFTFIDADADLVPDGLEIEVVLPCEKEGVSGTGELMGIRFTALDPWGCIPALTGTCSDTPTSLYVPSPPIPDDWEIDRCSIPPYYWVYQPKTDPLHIIWYTDKCWNTIDISGYIDKDDGTVHQDLGVWDGIWVKPWFADWYDKMCWVWDYFNSGVPGQAFPIGYYEFRPIPGDLNMDGHVDVEDLAAIAKVYGKTYTLFPTWPFYCNFPPAVIDNQWYVGECTTTTKTWHYFADFDLNVDGIVDIFDVVIVAKNICRTEPDPSYPQPIIDP